MTTTESDATSWQQGAVLGGCDVCRRSPAQRVKYSGVTGFLLARQHWAYEAILCRACSTGLFRKAQSKLLAGGWWSLFAIVFTPFLAIGNVMKLYQHRNSTAEPQPADPEADALLKGRPLYQRPGGILVLVVLLVIAVNAAVSASEARDTAPDLSAAAIAPEVTTPPVTTVAWDDLEIGACLDVTGFVAVPDRVTPLDCDEPHGYELYARVALEGAAYPGIDAINEASEIGCYDAFAPYVGRSYETSIYEVSYVTPTRSGWVSGDHTAECLIAGPGQPFPEDLTGMARDSDR